MEVKHASICAINGFAVATIGSSIAAATTASTVAMVVYAIFATGFAGLTIASITAAFDEKSTDANKYFETILDHAQIAITTLTSLLAGAAIEGVMRGVSDGIGRGISNAIAGRPVFEIRHSH